MKLLSIAVPCYHSAAYMEKCIDSLLKGGNEVEILIVDDGSYRDDTPRIADQYAAKYPDMVRAIHQPNSGHGGAVNTGLQYATGLYFKVVDSDDWVDHPSYTQILETLHSFSEREQPVDMLLSNFVYEKQGARRKMVMHYRKILPKSRIFTWNDVGHFRTGKYILMHSVIYRTEILRNSGMKLPEHTFYVDNIFVFYPLPYVKTMYYLDVNFYRYFIGREDQSVNEEVMISRIDQQIRVNKMMIKRYHADRVQIDSLCLEHYMLHYLLIITSISSVMCIRSKKQKNLEKKEQLWNDLKLNYPEIYSRLHRNILGFVLSMRWRWSRSLASFCYMIVQKIFGFN